MKPAAEDEPRETRAVPVAVAAPLAAAPEGRRSPGSWPIFAVGEEPMRVELPAGAGEASRLRLAVGLDLRSRRHWAS